MAYRANGQNFKGISIPSEAWERIFLPKPKGVHRYSRAKVTPVTKKP